MPPEFTIASGLAYAILSLFTPPRQLPPVAAAEPQNCISQIID